MKTSKIPLPKYSLGQEIWNAISHGIGSIFTLIAGPFMIVKASKGGDPYAIVSVSVMIFTMLLMFTHSCIYHALGRNNGKRVLRVLDHDMVFALIMGTYTPYCLVSLRFYHGFPLGWVMFGLVYAACITGIVLNSVNIDKFKIVSAVIQIAAGSVVVIFLFQLADVIGTIGTIMLLLGGVCQWIGAVLYAVGGKKNAWFHTVFHFFVDTGVLLMFFSIFYYVI